MIKKQNSEEILATGLGKKKTNQFNLTSNGKTQFKFYDTIMKFKWFESKFTHIFGSIFVSFSWFHISA